MLAPTVRRTWSPKGRTPVLLQRTRRTSKISGIGALSVSPDRRRVGLYLHWHPDANICREHTIVFLRDLLRHLRGQVIVVWDRIQTHRSGAILDWAAKHKRLQIELLPAYAPELNPIELVWSHLKYNEMPNHGLYELDALGRSVDKATRSTRDSQRVLRSCIHRCKLPIELK